MTQAELDILLREEVRQAIKENLERDPLRIALDGKLPYAREVATQVKYLQRARRKLPRLYDACCIIPPRAFEQSSSEDTARCKGLSGSRVLDLTCGLGIDTLALAERFDHVVSLERDEVLAGRLLPFCRRRLLLGAVCNGSWNRKQQGIRLRPRGDAAELLLD